MNKISRLLVFLCLWRTLVVSSASAAESDSTRFFREHPNEFDAVERAGSVLFANRQVGIELRRSKTGFELTRLYGIAEDQEFIVPPKANETRDLFEVQVTLDPKSVRKDERSTEKQGGAALFDSLALTNKAFVIGSHAAQSVSWKFARGEKASVLHLEWRGMALQEQKAMLNVSATITLRAGDPLTYWRMSVNNRSLKYGIERARLPILHLAPISDAKDNVFVYPKWRGGLVDDPFHAPAGLGENYHTKGAYYPYYINMQFWALYNRASGKGIYVGTQDSKPNLTHYLVKNSPTEITWSVAHFPANISYGAEDFAMSYDAIAGPFRGDWFDASQRYRAWALKQRWCAKGLLTTRADIPTWYKEAPLFFYTAVADSATGTHSQEENVKIAADDFRRWLKWSGMKLPCNWYGFEKPSPGRSIFDRPSSISRPYGDASNEKRWAGFKNKFTSYAGNYPAVPAMTEFATASRSLRAEGGMVCPYVCLQLFNQGPLNNAPFADEARLHMARDSYGSILTYPGLGMWLPCVCDEWWRARLVEECTALLDREHVGGFYLDVMHGTGMPCFWTPHGHAHAGADTMTTGMHELSKRVRDAVKAKDPEVITTGEDPAENMIDVTDGFLYQRTLRPENKVPLFAAVYQDYIPRYGLELSVGPGDSFFIECASLFVEGAQIGRIRLRPRSGILSFEDPGHKEMIDFLGRIVGYYKQPAAKKFLVYGQLMRPLTFSASPPMLAYGTDGTAQFPALMSGVFRAADGELGVFIVNAGAKELTFDSTLDLTACGMTKETSVQVEAMSPDGATAKSTTSAKGSVALKGTLPARGMAMFRILPTIKP